MSLTYMPYNPTADPKQYYAQGLQNLGMGFLGKYNRAQQAQDLQNLALYASGVLPSMPRLSTQFGQNLAGNLMGSMAQSATPSSLLNQWKLNMLKKMSPQQQLDYMLKPGTEVNLQNYPWFTDPKLTGEETPRKMAREEISKRTQPTATEREAYRDEAVKVIGSIPNTGWTWGTYDKKRNPVNAAYERYLANTGYSTANEERKKAIRESWYALMKQIKAGGFQGSNWSIGKNEVDWNPNDPKVKALEDQKAGEKPAEKGMSEIDWMGSVIVNPQTGERKRWNGQKWVTIK